MSTRIFRRPHRARGVATLEFVLTLPLLLLLLLATAEFGRAYIQYSQLSHAVRDAGRFLANAARTPTGAVVITPEVRTQAQNLVIYGRIAASGAALLPGLSAGNVQLGELPGNNVFLRVVYPYQPMVGSAIPGFYGSGSSLGFNLQAEIAMPAVPSNP